MSISIHALREESDSNRQNRKLWTKEFQSTPSARRATDDKGNKSLVQDISIHALREESDYVTKKIGDETMISIHALREEGDPTPPRKSLVVSYFNPRPPRGGRLADSKHYKRSAEFQSTPSARRATFFVVIAVEKTADFNPRPPRGGRLVLGAVHAAATGRISIHALREEGDRWTWRRTKRP